MLMRDSIYTIPLNEVFEPKDGCPICRLRNILEERCLTYIMGAAMMEPDVRIQTNQAGFCLAHFQRMLQAKNRLSLALMLESRLAYVAQHEMDQAGQKSGWRKKAPAPAGKPSCFVCQEVDRVLNRMIDTLLHMWQTDENFRALYGQQPVICLEHCQQLVAAANGKLGKKAAPFVTQTRQITQTYLTQLQEDVTHFCRMYDYRNQGKDWGNSRDSIERAIRLLTGVDFRE